MKEIKRIVESILVPHAMFASATERLSQCFAYASNTPEPINLALLGESRTGKSRAIDEFYSMHRPYRTAEGLNVPVLKIRTPSRPTVKSLAELMLSTIGDPRSEIGTENVKSMRLVRLLRSTGSQMLILDEFHHFVDKASDKVIFHVADWLKVLADSANVALVVAGLPSCTAVLDQNEQLAGRFMAPVTLRRFDWKADYDREEFVSILGAFHEGLQQHFHFPLLDSEDLSFQFYCATGGKIGYITKLLRQCVWNAMDNDSSTIDLADIATAYEQALWKRPIQNNPFRTNPRLAKTECPVVENSAKSEVRPQSGSIRDLPKKNSRKKGINEVLSTR